MGTHSCGAAKRACYFCNDVSAPTDSLKERTLDKQCTVVRPGVSGWSAAVAAELVVSLSQHPDRWEADQNEKKVLSCLGTVPAQLRGYLADYRISAIETEPFKHCVCCSDMIRQKYRDEDVFFLETAVKNSSVLEQVSGLEQMKCDMDKQMEASMQRVGEGGGGVSIGGGEESEEEMTML